MWEPEPGERVISACRDPTPQHRVKARVMPSTIPSPSTLAPAADRSLALKAAAGVLFVAVVALSWVLGHGLAGPGYLVLYALLLLPGLPLGFLLFGRGHAAGWIAGALIGYGLSAIVLWIPVDLGFAGHAWAPTAWAALTAATHLIARGSQAVVVLPPWHRGDTAGLLCALLVVPLLVAGPFSRVGERDPAGNLRYRAYFTADFLWHVALTAELAKADPPIRNPYLERRALNYYWAYFVPPAMIARSVGAVHSLEACLLLNALCAGLLFVASIYLYGWCVVPRAGPILIAVLLTMLAASAEGLLALIRLARDHLPLASLRSLNVDALTAWIFQGLTVDSLPRSLWYTPQHAAACGLGLIGLIGAGHSSKLSLKGRAPRRRSSRPVDCLQPIPRRVLLCHLRRRRHLERIRTKRAPGPRDCRLRDGGRPGTRGPCVVRREPDIRRRRRVGRNRPVAARRRGALYHACSRPWTDSHARHRRADARAEAPLPLACVDSRPGDRADALLLRVPLDRARLGRLACRPNHSRDHDAARRRILRGAG